eukprot:3518131-Rhodomonas_salina.1
MQREGKDGRGRMRGREAGGRGRGKEGGREEGEGRRDSGRARENQRGHPPFRPAPCAASSLAISSLPL